MTGRTLALCIGLLSGLPAAGGERLDDSASPRQRVEATVEWLAEGHPDDLSDDEFHTVVGRVSAVEVRLDTARFAGREAQIFLRVPVQVRGLRSPNGLRVEWRTQGVFADGSVVPGGRTKIFEGVVPGAVMADIFDFVLYVDSRELFPPLAFEPIYEIDPR